MKKFVQRGLALVVAGTLAACGGGGGSSDSNSETSTGDLNLAITDAPVDGASAV